MPALRRLRRRILAVLWRSTLLIAVFSCGLVALRMGVGVSEHTDTHQADILTHIYYTIGLFVLGGLDLGMPEGGPDSARAMLWFAYFAAPALTFAAGLEGILRVVGSTRWRLRWMRGHIIVAGCGRIGQLYLKKLRALHPGKQVIIVDSRPDQGVIELSEIYRAGVVAGDIRDDALLSWLRLDHASRVFVAAGNDFTSLDAAAKIVSRAPGLAGRVIAHISDLSFVRVMAHTQIAERCVVFNSHQAAASELMRTRLLGHFARTQTPDVVVLAGFGRFGQSVLDELQRAAPETFEHVIILDQVAETGAAIFDQQVGFADFYTREIVQGDLRDPRTWRLVEATEQPEPVFILGSGDDSINMSVALWATAKFPKAFVLVRKFYSSPFADELSAEGGFTTFCIADLISGSMPEDWFG